VNGENGREAALADGGLLLVCVGGWVGDVGCAASDFTQCVLVVCAFVPSVCGPALCFFHRPLILFSAAPFLPELA